VLKKSGCDSQGDIRCYQSFGSKRGRGGQCEMQTRMFWEPIE
jgi:hypothetical protein